MLVVFFKLPLCVFVNFRNVAYQIHEHTLPLLYFLFISRKIQPRHKEKRHKRITMSDKAFTFALLWSFGSWELFQNCWYLLLMLKLDNPHHELIHGCPKIQLVVHICEHYRHLTSGNLLYALFSLNPNILLNT